MNSSKETTTPMTTNCYLDPDKGGKRVDMYRDMIRSLLYLTTNRPEIMQLVSICARFQTISK